MNLLNERANIFLTEAKEVNLEVLPYKKWFLCNCSSWRNCGIEVMRRFRKSRIYLL